MKTRWILATLVLGLGVAMALLWLLGGGMSNVARAQGSDGHDTYYVAPGADCGGITPCFSSIQDAVDNVDDPDDVVKVAASTYTGVSAREGVTQVVYISKTVTIRGGYITTSWMISDPDSNPTILDAQGQGRVLYIIDNISPTIEGLHITGGDASGLGGGYWGSDCGGGVYIDHGSSAVQLNSSQVFSNVAEIGGGICLHHGDATLNGNKVFFNAADDGGGLWLYSTGAARINSNTIFSNTASGTGGGVSLFLDSAESELEGNTIMSNTSSNMGGGLLLQSSDATLSGNVIRGNTDSGTGGWWNGGGGLYMCCGSTPMLINNVIADNWAISGRGSGLVIRDSSPRLLHTTIARNSGDDGSGIYVFSEGSGGSTVALTNTILVSHSVGISVTNGNTVTVMGVLWYNTPITVSEGITAIVNVQNQYTGNPAFATDGYHITFASNAMDVGISAGVNKDIDDHHRPYGSAPDLGADEIIAIAAELHVCPSGCAYSSVQAAVDAANEGDIIKVAVGTYTGAQGRPAPPGYLGSSTITQVVYISKSVAIQGGYTTSFAEPADPDINPTTLNAEGEGRVIVIAGNTNPTIAGLRITGGDAAGLGGADGGGGHAVDSGGGVYVISATATFTSNTIYDNTASFGGGLHMEYSDSHLAENTVRSNTSEAQGGGLYLDFSDATIIGNTIYDNDASSGGGLTLYVSDATIIGNRIYSNSADYGGGVDTNWAATLIGNIIYSNSGVYGGGLRTLGDAILINNVIVDNQVDTTGHGSGVYIRGCSPDLLHNTIAHNSGGDGSGVYVTKNWWNAPDTVALTNTVLVGHAVGISVTGGNTVTVNGVLWYNTPITVSQSITAIAIVQNQHTGDPAFAPDGYHITLASNAMDVGISAGVNKDIDDHHRPYGSAPDLGADEIIAISVPTDTESTLVYTDTQGSPTIIQLPAGAVTDTITLVYVPVETATPPSGFSFAGHAFDLDVYQDGTLLLPSFAFSGSVTITIYYTDTDVVGLDESALVLEYWDEITSVWEDAACGPYDRHPDENWLAAPVCHLSRFALFGKGHTIYLPLVLRNY